MKEYQNALSKGVCGPHAMHYTYHYTLYTTRVPLPICPMIVSTLATTLITVQSIVSSATESPTTTSNSISPTSRGKVMVVDQDDEFPLPVFEFGTTFSRTILMRSQRRNHAQHTRHHLERQSRDLDITIPMDEDVPSPLVSPLPMNNQFHPLSNTDSEEDIWCIADVSPLLLVIRDVPPHTRCSTTTKFWSILCWLGQDSGQSKMAILHDLGAVVLIRLRPLVWCVHAMERRDRV